MTCLRSRLPSAAAAADALEAQAREIEGLRKDYDALILQLVEALEYKGRAPWKKRQPAIAAARARLEGKP